jgi:hypothetical protein
MELFGKIKAELQFRYDMFRERVYERKMIRKYGDYNRDADVGSLRIIKGSPFWEEDFEIYYDRDTNKYTIGVETAYVFESPKGQIDYLHDILAEFEYFIKDNNIEVVVPYSITMRNLSDGFESDSIGELYQKFKIFVLGFEQYLKQEVK